MRDRGHALALQEADEQQVSGDEHDWRDEEEHRSAHQQHDEDDQQDDDEGSSSDHHAYGVPAQSDRQSSGGSGGRGIDVGQPRRRDALALFGLGQPSAHAANHVARLPHVDRVDFMRDLGLHVTANVARLALVTGDV
jgi:hypothetical protein